MNIRMLSVRAAGAVIVACAGGAAHAQCVTGAALPISGAAASDGAGRAIMMTTTPTTSRLIVGIPFDNTAWGNDTGSVWIYDRLSNGNWSVQDHLYAGDAAPSDFFGTSVAVGDLYAVVGAPGTGAGGGAYFFERSGVEWNQVMRFAPPAAGAGDVGRSVAIDGAFAVIGTPGYDMDHAGDPAPDAGGAYIARRTANGQWEVPTVLVRGSSPTDPVAGDRYGWSVAAAGGVIVVGAPYAESPGQADNCGQAVAWRHDGQSVTSGSVLLPSLPQQDEHMGWSVATDGSSIALGAPFNDRTAQQGGALTDSGCVHLRRYENGQWWLDGVVRASDASDFALFGSSVAMRNGRLIVAAEGVNKVYIFRRGAYVWYQEAVLTDPQGAADGLFGTGVAFDGTHVAVGDAGDDLGGAQVNAGAVYTFAAPGLVQADTCGGAIPIGVGQYAGCTALAVRESLTICGGISQGPDVWHSFTPTCAGTATLHTGGSDYDTLLSVHDQCPTPGGDSHTIACNDNAGGALGNASQVTFPCEAGVTYYIRVSGANNASGAYNLTLLPTGAPASDACASAPVITDGVHTFGTCGATGGFPAVSGCGPQSILIGNDVWFRYTAPITGAATADLCGSNFDTAVAAYAGWACPTQDSAPIACSNDDPSCPAGRSRLVFDVVEGSNYLIRVGGANVGTGTVVMDLSTATGCAADWNADGVVNSSDISAFLAAWLASVQGADLAADFNADQAVNSTDISAFLTAWLAAVSGGC